MSVGAAISITSSHEARVIEHASNYARRHQAEYFVISVVPALPYGASTEGEHRAVMHNLELITACGGSAVMQEGKNVARVLLAVASGLGLRTLFLQSGPPRLLRRSIAQQLIYLRPPFDVVGVGSG